MEILTLPHGPHHHNACSRCFMKDDSRHMAGQRHWL